MQYDWALEFSGDGFRPHDPSMYPLSIGSALYWKLYLRLYLDEKIFTKNRKQENKNKMLFSSD